MEFSRNWLSSASDEELKVEGERIRQEYCASGDDFDKGCELQEILFEIGDELNKRAWGDEEPHGPSFHREHGWYLSDDD